MGPRDRRLGALLALLMASASPGQDTPLLGGAAFDPNAASSGGSLGVVNGASPAAPRSYAGSTYSPGYATSSYATTPSYASSYAPRSRMAYGNPGGFGVAFGSILQRVLPVVIAGLEAKRQRKQTEEVLDAEYALQRAQLDAQLEGMRDRLDDDEYERRREQSERVLDAQFDLRRAQLGLSPKARGTSGGSSGRQGKRKKPARGRRGDDKGKKPGRGRKGDGETPGRRRSRQDPDELMDKVRRQYRRRVGQES